MTITLHCSHCNQSMAIAPRKPGSRVECPSCGRIVVVPPGEAADGPMPPAPERENAGSPALSRTAHASPAGVDRGGAVATAPQRARTATASTVNSPMATAAVAPRHQSPKPGPGESEVPWLPQPAAGTPSLRPSELPARAAAPEGVVLPKSVLILLIVFALAALGCAFFAGILFGKQIVTESRAASLNPLPQARRVQALACGCGLNEISLKAPPAKISLESDSSQPGAIPHAC